jgi:hypothetical protein
MPLSTELRQYRQALVTYYVDTGSSQDQAEALADIKFADDVDLEYAKNCRINSLNNDRKSAFIFKANGYII